MRNPENAKEAESSAPMGLSALCAHYGITKPTVRTYVRDGLLPKPVLKPRMIGHCSPPGVVYEWDRSVLPSKAELELMRSRRGRPWRGSRELAEAVT